MKWILVGVYAFAVIGLSFVVNDRVCGIGLSECITPLEPAEPLAYVATRRLVKGDLVHAADLKAPERLSAEAVNRLPARTDLVNKYVKDAVAVGSPVRVTNLTELPIVRWPRSGCLATAEGGELGSARLLRPGRRVLVACEEPEDCDAKQWTVVAEVESASDDSHPVLISRRKPCAASHSLTVVGIGR